MKTFDLNIKSRASWLLAALLLLLGPGCTPRLYTRPGLCGSGLRVENKAVALTFDKAWVLRCAAQRAEAYRNQPTVAADIRRLAQHFAADTARLVTVADPRDIARIDTALLVPLMLFGYIDGLLLRRRMFCAQELTTGQYLPWVKFKWYRNSEDAEHVLLAPNGTSLYSTHH